MKSYTVKVNLIGSAAIKITDKERETDILLLLYKDSHLHQSSIHLIQTNFNINLQNFLSLNRINNTYAKTPLYKKTSRIRVLHIFFIKMCVTYNKDENIYKDEGHIRMIKNLIYTILTPTNFGNPPFPFFSLKLIYVKPF